MGRATRNREVLRKGRDVVTAATEGRDFEHETVDAIEEVGPE